MSHKTTEQWKWENADKQDTVSRKKKRFALPKSGSIHREELQKCVYIFR